MSDKIIDRIRKLFALSQSDNPGEAANALAMAQRLMQKHRIEQAQLEAPDAEEIRIWADDPLDHGGHIPPWKQAVGGAIAEVNDCLCLVSERHVLGGRERVMVIAGRESDFEVCLAMYTWIIGEIDRLAHEANRRHAARFRMGGMGRRWLNSFRHGAGAEVEGRLYREQREARAKLYADPKTSTALDIRRDAVHQWAEENIETRDAKGRTSPIDPEAYELGAMAGRVLPLREDDATG